MFFDIGANIGKWTIANINATNKIIAIEASPCTFENLKIHLKNQPNVEILNYAICDNNSEPTQFHHCTDADTLSTLNSKWLTSNDSRFYNYRYNTITVNTLTIDKLIENYGMPDLIKIDVEGGEYECIKSLTQKSPVLCFEWASELNEISTQSLDHLYSIGFTQFYLQFEDNYTFRPSEYNETIESIKDKLTNTRKKVDWGMIWCK